MNRQAAMKMNHRGGGARDKRRREPGEPSNEPAAWRAVRPLLRGLENSTTADAERLRLPRRPMAKERGPCAGRTGNNSQPPLIAAAGSAWAACLEVVSG